MRVSQLDIPSSVEAILRSEGYEELYPPQEEAVKAGALDGKNLVLASPTASGKTLIAELCILKSVLAGRGKALYLTPLRALAREKFKEFEKYKAIRKRSGDRVRIGLTTGDYDSSDPWLRRFDVVISTNEKLDSLLRHRAEWIDDVTVLVADEAHLLTDGHRGPTLEVVLTRLRQINSKLQVLALSATIRNAEEVAEWINAAPITTEWRPVPLKEGVYYDGTVQFKDGSIKPSPVVGGNHVLDVALNVVGEGAQALVFAETRKRAVEIGKQASMMLRGGLTARESKRLKNAASKVLGAAERTRLSENLAAQVQWGAAFHHAGLGPAHRHIIEDLFRLGLIKVLAATPTLAAGVNLPARTVILSSYERYEPGYGRYPISVLEYKQFSGRAGRPRYDEFGESILIAKTEEEKEYLMENYVYAKPEKLWSKLAAEGVLRPHILSTIAAGFAHSQEGLHTFFSRTFYAHQYGPRMIRSRIDEILEFLCKEEMVELSDERLVATDFGRRTSELYIDPLSAVLIRDGLHRRASNLTDLSFLHLIAHTPDATPRMYPRRREAEMLELLAQEHSDEFLFEVPDPWQDEVSYDEFLAELKCASVLIDWIQEKREDEISAIHLVESGDLLRIVEIADWLLYSTHELARLFQQKDVLRTLNILRARVKSGVKEELLQLIQLKGIGRIRARMLHDRGLRTLSELRRSSISDLLAIPSIGPALAKRIKEQAGGKISSEEWQRVRRPESAVEEQKLITEY